jgi:hypothetical protein
MTKSPKHLAEMALRAARQALPERSHRFSPKKFTQPQIFAILVLKAFFKTDYRGIVAMLADFRDLQRALGLKQVPHFSTLWHAEQRLLKKGLLIYSREPYFDSLSERGFYEVKNGASSMLRA